MSAGHLILAVGLFGLGTALGYILNRTPKATTLPKQSTTATSCSYCHRIGCTKCSAYGRKHH